MKTALAAYAGCLLTLAVVDALWLGIVARSFYRDQLGALMLPAPLWPARCRIARHGRSVGRKI